MSKAWSLETQGDSGSSENPVSKPRKLSFILRTVERLPGNSNHETT